jgi:hypothetical protein
MVQKIAWFVFVFNLLAYCIYLIFPIEFRKGIHHIEVQNGMSLRIRADGVRMRRRPDKI